MVVFASGPETIHKPRILCLHGGGVSARIFRLQARSLVASLAPYFRLVFADGPFPCIMHEDLKPVYSQMGPCYSWASWMPHHVTPDGIDADTVINEIEDKLRMTMKADPGTGEWVGLLGFSQGAKLTTSILLENQMRQEEARWDWRGNPVEGFAGVHWKFGVVMAGRGPPISLSDRSKDSLYFDLAGTPINASGSFAGRVPEDFLLRTPTLHVHGTRDEGLPLHQKLLRQYMAPESAILVEWEGKHRVPIRSADVGAVTQGILQIYKDSRFA
ncbi:uncharacterized protein K452DRAFT_287480 [Aplosporella prunicola CBS 121167]|uniref:Serine hydrolase domain-containing protein n=1 Tax=Aplosporella prunicola CBS 121167 TaxID=1176127 RepID=A0A6A6BDJ3_9PEZI|nr:uncharacterized protein K452DRAFT_287480 [Aplosporella prunicola CBS 121167]KAF2142259.1 hypothetical protein K452DRAFT_287480 [Aplosporella prunicola CBS 121167]